jgi:hypothetical protein
LHVLDRIAAKIFPDGAGLGGPALPAAPRIAARTANLTLTSFETVPLLYRHAAAAGFGL